MSECGNSPKNGWHLWVSGSSQKIGKTPVCYWCGKRKDQEETDHEYLFELQR